MKRSSEHHALLAATDREYEDSVLGSGPGLVADVPPSPPPSTPPPVSRPVSRRLTIQAAVELVSSPSAPSVAESHAVAPSCPESPEICCSQVRLQEYELSGRYPTPPPAPLKDQYIQPSESEAESSDSERSLRQPPAKILRNGQLMYHKAYDGPKPITYVDTRLYQGGRNDYIEAFNQDEVIWVRKIRDVLDAHNIPRRSA
jgi:hypothetical protein